MKKALSLLGTIILALSMVTLTGCFGDDGDKYQAKAKRPRFYSKLSPAQQSYWDNMNQNKKKEITKVQADADQYERFKKAWNDHIK